MEDKPDTNDLNDELESSEVEVDELLFEDLDSMDDHEESVQISLDESSDEDSMAPADTWSLSMAERLSLAAQVEAIVFATPQPVKLTEIAEILEEEGDTKAIFHILGQLEQEYRERGGGFILKHITGQGYQFQTVEAASPLMEKMFSTRPRPISRAAQETLAIIAYRQPVTRADIEFIRGVDAGSIIKNLLERDLIKCAGRKEDAGRPMIFATTDEFLRVYRLNSLADLPPIEAFQPSQDMIQGAMQSLAGHVPVDVDTFMDDPERVSLSEESDEMDQPLDLPARIKESLDDIDDATTEVDLPVGDSVTPRGRDVDW
jgi:segregation and condensation protein B